MNFEVHFPAGWTLSHTLSQVIWVQESRHRLAACADGLRQHTAGAPPRRRRGPRAPAQAPCMHRRPPVAHRRVPQHCTLAPELPPDAPPAQRRLAYVAAGGVAGSLAVYRHDPKQLHFDIASASGAAVRLLDAEAAHNLGLWAAAAGLFPCETRPDPPSLRTVVWGRTFANPIGAAMGRRGAACCVLLSGWPGLRGALAGRSHGASVRVPGSASGRQRRPAADRLAAGSAVVCAQACLPGLTRTPRRCSRCWTWALASSRSVRRAAGFVFFAGRPACGRHGWAGGWTALAAAAAGGWRQRER